MSDTLRQKLIRLAHDNASLRPHLLPLLQKTAGKDTVAFVTWAIETQSPVPTDRVIQFLERNGIEKGERGESKRGLPIAKGEHIEIQANNAPGDLQDLLQPFHLLKGVVMDVEGQDVICKMENQKILRVPGGVNSGKTSGVYRTTVLDTVKGMKHLEVVYLAANERPPTQVQTELVQQYVEKGLAQGEDRSEIYYTGYVSSYMISKEGKPYFMLWSQQRGGRPRTLSPDKGKVLYIGLVGKRPAGWEQSYTKLINED